MGRSEPEAQSGRGIDGLDGVVIVSFRNIHITGIQPDPQALSQLNHNSASQIVHEVGFLFRLFKLKFKDVQAFNDYVITFRKQTNIKKTLTMVVTTTIKEEL